MLFDRSEQFLNTKIRNLKLDLMQESVTAKRNFFIQK